MRRVLNMAIPAGFYHGLPALIPSLILAAATAFGAQQVDGPELRIIVVDTEAAAGEVRDGIARGISIERLAQEHSVDPSKAAGGYMGVVAVGDLRREFQEAIEGLTPGEVSALTPLDDWFFLIQLLGEDEKTWIAHKEAGFRAFGEGRYPAAIESLSAAVDAAEQLEPDRLALSLANLAEVHRFEGDYVNAVPLYDRAVVLYEASLGPDHPDLALTLNNQALLHHAQEEYAKAEPLYERALGIWDRTLGAEHLNVAAGLNNLGAVRQARGARDEAEALFRRALEIRERNLGSDHPDVAQSLSSLGELKRVLEDYGEAEALLRRALEIFERALGTDHASTVTTRNALTRTLVQEVYERFTDVVSLASFRDEEYRAAREAFARSMTRAPVAEESYLGMADIFTREDMVSEAELMLREMAQRFESREAYYHLGELHVNSGATEAALEAFEQASITPGPSGLDPVIDAQMRSFISRRIGDLHGGAGRFDEAIAAYDRAFEIDPAIVESRLGRGVVYFRSLRREEALEDYRWVLDMDPDNVAVLNRLAEALLSLERFEESAQAAMRALEIDPDLLTPRYLRGRALVAMGQTEEGIRLIQEYQLLDTERQAEEQRTREIIALDRDAMAQLLEGQYEIGIQMYREAIETHADAPQLYFKLGLAQNKLGRHGEAADTFLTLIELGLSDDFIVHKNLAAAYRALGNAEASERHQALYLEKRDAEMALD